MDNDSGTRTIVPHCHTDESYKTLGVMIAPDDNNTLKVDRMNKITLQFENKIRVEFID